MINSAVAADWNADGKIDVVASLDGKVMLFIFGNPNYWLGRVGSGASASRNRATPPKGGATEHPRKCFTPGAKRPEENFNAQSHARQSHSQIEREPNSTVGRDTAVGRR